MSNYPLSLRQILVTIDLVLAEKAELGVLAEMLPQTLQMITEMSGSVEQGSWSMVITDKVADELHFYDLGCKRQKELLGNIEKQISSSRITFQSLSSIRDDLFNSARASDDILQSLQDAKAQEKDMSPYPALDSLLKAAQNVKNGKVSDEAISFFYQPSVRCCLLMDKAIERFGILYENEELVSLAQPLLRELKFGIGALDEYLQQGTESSLNDIVTCLQPTSLVLWILIRDMIAFKENNRKYAKHAVCEDLFRAKEKNLSPEDMAMLWESLDDNLRLDFEQIAVISSDPLTTLCGVQLKVINQAAEEVDKYVKLLKEEGLEDENIKLLDERLMHLSRVLKYEKLKLTSEFDKVRGNDRFEELLVVLGLAMRGELSYDEFGVFLQDYIDSAQAIRNDVSVEAKGSYLSAESKELDMYMQNMLQAFEDMLKWDGTINESARNLRNGWIAISSCLPYLNLIKDNRRRSLGLDSKPPEILCVKCGASNNPNDNYCSKCSAVLIHLEVEPEEYTDVNETQSQVYFGNVGRLENLKAKIISGKATNKEIQTVMEELLSGAESVANVFYRTLLPSIKNNNGDGTLLANFQKNLQQYIDGIHEAGKYLHDNDILHFANGISMCAQASQELNDLKMEINFSYN